MPISCNENECDKLMKDSEANTRNFNFKSKLKHCLFYQCAVSLKLMCVAWRCPDGRQCGQMLPSDVLIVDSTKSNQEFGHMETAPF